MTDRHLHSVPTTETIILSDESRELVDLLSPQSSVADRLRVLGKCGIDKTILQQNGIMQEEAYDAYLNEQEATEPLPSGGIILDDLRMVTRHMLWNGVSPKQVGEVLVMPLNHLDDEVLGGDEELTGKTLLEAVVIDPMAALSRVVERYGYNIPGQEIPAA
jgi:hypothetical protein